MADYWKSQPKKFCQYCKCWIADNKPSVEFHERGKNHKENVAAKIAEIKKKSLDKAKQEDRMSKDFAAMEEAALKAYEKDMKRLGIDSGPQVQTTVQAQPPPQKPEKTKKQASKVAKKLPTRSETWVDGKTDDGHTYYYNTVTGESHWEKPKGFQGGRSVSAQLGQNKSSSGGTWMESVSPDGYTYYYNTQTGESSWERPAALPSKEASGSGREGEGQEDPSVPQPEPPAGGEESTNKASEEAADNGQDAPKISIMKRNAETEPSEEKAPEDEAGGDTPKADGEGKTVEEEAQSTTAKPEEKKEEVPKRAKRQRVANPYGTWEQIQEEEDPYLKVDLQLPQVEGGVACVPDAPPPEPKPKFRERTITSLGEEGGGGHASFRKSKTQNGKSRSLRQRGEDD